MTNMNLKTINGSDFVSPQPINDNFEELDKMGKDYIVDSGTSGSWWFRKYKSGRAECGIDDQAFGDMHLSNRWGIDGLNVSETVSFGNYPFAFKSKPYVNIVLNGIGDHSGGVYDYLVSKNSDFSSTVSPGFQLHSGYVSNLYTPHFGIFVSGWLK